MTSLAQPRPSSGPVGSIARPLAGGRARIVVAGCLVVVTVVSSSNINPVLLGAAPETPSNLQQYLTILAWLVIIGASFSLPARSRVGPWLDVAAGAAFLAYAIVSSAWSSAGAASFLKAAALAITTLGAYRVAVTTSVAVVTDCVVAGLVAVTAASVATVLVAPGIGVIGTWMHNGQWSGIYESKQSLGVAGAFLIFFSFCRLRLRGGWLAFLASFGLGAAAVLGSGSRGGGAVALCAVLCVLLSNHSRLFSRALLVAPALLTVAAVATLLGLEASGRSKLDILGTETDLTERVVIWQYALGKLSPHLLAGYGLNGFWTDAELYDAFRRTHGWVLDNFHSGYLTILIELGMIGIVLFTLAALLYAFRMSARERTGLVDAARFNMISGFIFLVFVYNLTETFFLRSTTLISALLTVFFLASAAVPVSGHARLRPDAALRAAASGPSA